MNALAVIPARGGSKGLPRKNIRPFCGKPLIAWTIENALAATAVRRVVVSTDDAQIAEVSSFYGAEIVWRPPEISTDDSPSEAALLHALQQLAIDSGLLAFLQCTSPLTLPADIDGTVEALQQADSAFTAAPWQRFVWKSEADGAVPVGHDMAHRPLRQQRERQYIETGAVYAMRIPGFLQARHRFFGKTAMYVVAPERSLEIDDEHDFLLAETLMRQRLRQAAAKRLPAKIRAVVTDFDGVLTDNRVQVDDVGQESVTCHRGDGWALRRLRDAGLHLLVLTGETSASVIHRCRKLDVECLVAAGDKLPPLRQWLARHGLEPAHTVYVGNDEPDVPCMRYVGCAVAPADAYPPARAAAHIVLTTPGGYGCLRELAGLLLT